MKSLEEKVGAKLKPCRKEWIPVYGPLQAIADNLNHKPSYLGDGFVDEPTIVWNIYHTYATGLPLAYISFLLSHIS